MVIGAHQDDDKGTSSGSAYVFTRDTAGDLGSGWTQVAKLTADDGTGYDRFGYSVSIDGDTVVVGAQTDDDEGDNSGSAFVFTRDTAGDLASGWTQVAKLTAGDGAASDYFGYSVSIDGDTMVVGAYFDDDKATNSGSAYVYTRDTAGDLASGWTQVAKLTADDGADSDKFGYSVSIDGDTMVIGAYQDDDKGLNSGSAYVFTRDTAGNLTSSWTQVAKLTADDGAADDQFGYSVSIDGDTVVIGANHDDDKATNSGSAYVFTRDTPGDLTSNWTQVAKLTAGDGAADDVFGISVSIDGDTMVIGALGDDAVHRVRVRVLHTLSSLRRIIAPSQRRRRRLHGPSRERVHVSARVRPGIRPDWTDRVRQRRVNTRRMQHLLRRIRASRERRSRQLHGVPAERYDVPTHVRGVSHGVGRHDVRRRDDHSNPVRRTVRRVRASRERRSG